MDINQFWCCILFLYQTTLCDPWYELFCLFSHFPNISATTRWPKSPSCRLRWGSWQSGPTTTRRSNACRPESKTERTTWRSSRTQVRLARRNRYAQLSALITQTNVSLLCPLPDAHTELWGARYDEALNWTLFKESALERRSSPASGTADRLTDWLKQCPVFCFYRFRWLCGCKLWGCVLWSDSCIFFLPVVDVSLFALIGILVLAFVEAQREEDFREWYCWFILVFICCMSNIWCWEHFAFAHLKLFGFSLDCIKIQVHVKAVILKKTRRSTVNSHPQVFDLKMNIKISRIVVTMTLRYRCCSIKSEADQSYTLKGRGALKIWLKAKVISVLW